jgi:DNA-directed RNA polymerase specialized sigma24 family protein
LLRLASHTNDEIAGKLGCSVATVKRRVAEIRQCWAGSSDT